MPVFWVLAQRSLVEVYRRLRRPCAPRKIQNVYRIIQYKSIFSDNYSIRIYLIWRKPTQINNVWNTSFKLVDVAIYFTYLLTPWHYSPDGHKPPLIRFHSLTFSVFVEQVANLLPQHFFESPWFNRQENITGEKRVSISLMLCRVLLHAVNLWHGTDGFTSEGSAC
jgi:hypothetical protein